MKTSLAGGERGCETIKQQQKATIIAWMLLKLLKYSMRHIVNLFYF